MPQLVHDAAGEVEHIGGHVGVATADRHGERRLLPQEDISCQQVLHESLEHLRLVLDLLTSYGMLRTGLKGRWIYGKYGGTKGTCLEGIGRLWQHRRDMVIQANHETADLILVPDQLVSHGGTFMDGREKNYGTLMDTRWHRI